MEVTFSQEKQVKCSSCGELLRKSKYKKERLSTQQFNNEATNRDRVGKFCNLRQQDFETKKEWNDYLEKVEDMVFDLTYGSPKEKQDADQRLTNFAKKYAKEIQLNKEIEIQEAQKRLENQHKQEDFKNKNINPQAEMKQQAEHYRQMHPATKDLPMCLDRDDNPIIPKNITWEQLLNLQRIAGGFDVKLSKKKDQYEAMAGLLDF